jgi:mediator of RNA polymerase II transcription subunit 7
MHLVNLYTDENIKRGWAPKPPPPVKDVYSMFGVTFRADDPIIRPLESQSLLRLYPQNYDHKRELKKLNYSILVNFLDLLDVLIRAPDSARRTEKIDDLTLLFIHMHHLINEFRPHQARETLRVMLESQKRQRLETIDRFQKHLTHVTEMLQLCVAALPDDAELDTKLVIKMEPGASTASASSGSQKMLCATPIKLERTLALPHVKEEKDDSDDGSNVDEASVMECETLDRMMCDIVDAMI